MTTRNRRLLWPWILGGGSALVLLVALLAWALSSGQPSQPGIGSEQERVHRYGEDFDEPRPPLPTPEEARQIRAEVFQYLAKKCGTTLAEPNPLPSVNAGQCVSAYDAAAQSVKTGKNAKKQSGPPQMLYRLVYEHLLIADALGQASRSGEQRLDGLDIAREAALCSVERLRDRWLGPRVCNGFLIPRLEHASPESYDKLSVPNLIATCLYVYGEADSEQDAVIGYRLLLHVAVDQNTREATRLRLANMLARHGNTAEAMRYLKGIDPEGPLGGARVVLADLEKGPQQSKKGKK